MIDWMQSVYDRLESDVTKQKGIILVHANEVVLI